MRKGYVTSKDDKYLSIIKPLYNLSRKICKNGAFYNSTTDHDFLPPLFGINAVAPRLFLRFESDVVIVQYSRQLDRLDSIALRQSEWMDMVLDFGWWVSNSACQWAVSWPHPTHLQLATLLNASTAGTNRQISRRPRLSWLLETATHTLSGSQTTTERQPRDRVSQSSSSTANLASLARYQHRVWACGPHIHRVSIFAMETFPAWFEWAWSIILSAGKWPTTISPF